MCSEALLELHSVGELHRYSGQGPVPYPDKRAARSPPPPARQPSEALRIGLAESSASVPVPVQQSKPLKAGARKNNKVAIDGAADFLEALSNMGNPNHNHDLQYQSMTVCASLGHIPTLTQPVASILSDTSSSSHSSQAICIYENKLVVALRQLKAMFLQTLKKERDDHYAAAVSVCFNYIASLNPKMLPVSFVRESRVIESLQQIMLAFGTLDEQTRLKAKEALVSLCKKYSIEANLQPVSVEELRANPANKILVFISSSFITPSMLIQNPLTLSSAIRIVLTLHDLSPTNFLFDPAACCTLMYKLHASSPATMNVQQCLGLGLVEVLQQLAELGEDKKVSQVAKRTVIKITEVFRDTNAVRPIDNKKVEYLLELFYYLSKPTLFFNEELCIDVLVRLREPVINTVPLITSVIVGSPHFALLKKFALCAGLSASVKEEKMARIYDEAKITHCILDDYFGFKDVSSTLKDKTSDSSSDEKPLVLFQDHKLKGSIPFPTSIQNVEKLFNLLRKFLIQEPYDLEVCCIILERLERTDADAVSVSEFDKSCVVSAGKMTLLKLNTSVNTSEADYVAHLKRMGLKELSVKVNTKKRQGAKFRNLVNKAYSCLVGKYGLFTEATLKVAQIAQSKCTGTLRNIRVNNGFMCGFKRPGGEGFRVQVTWAGTPDIVDPSWHDFNYLKDQPVMARYILRERVELTKGLYFYTASETASWNSRLDEEDRRRRIAELEKKDNKLSQKTEMSNSVRRCLGLENVSEVRTSKGAVTDGPLQKETRVPYSSSSSTATATATVKLTGSSDPVPPIPKDAVVLDLTGIENSQSSQPLKVVSILRKIRANDGFGITTVDEFKVQVTWAGNPDVIDPRWHTFKKLKDQPVMARYILREYVELTKGLYFYTTSEKASWDIRLNEEDRRIAELLRNPNKLSASSTQSASKKPKIALRDTPGASSPVKRGHEMPQWQVNTAYEIPSSSMDIDDDPVLRSLLAMSPPKKA